MKQNPFRLYKYVVIGLLLALAFFNCSKITVVSQCVEDENGICLKRQGNTQLLSKKSVDILLVLDNSPLGQKLSPQITDNLNQMVQCIEPLDWQIGIIYGTQNKKTPMGKLLTIKQGDTAKFISPDMPHYKQAFQHTVSLTSSCDKLASCPKKGKQKPLSALQAFMQNTEEKALFLRESATLAVVLVSSSDEKKRLFSRPEVSPQEVLSSISLDYSSDQWIAHAVTSAGQKDDCIKTATDFVQKGAGFVAKMGQVVGIITVNPLIILGSSVLKYQADKPRPRAKKLSQFVSGGGGQIFDICKPFFGRAVAYSILKSVNRESQFPKSCQQFDKSQTADLKSP